MTRSRLEPCPSARVGMLSPACGSIVGRRIGFLTRSWADHEHVVAAGGRDRQRPLGVLFSLLGGRASTDSCTAAQ